VCVLFVCVCLCVWFVCLSYLFLVLVGFCSVIAAFVFFVYYVSIVIEEVAV